METRILVVEDDAEIADSLVRGLAEEGFVVAHAPDGDAARVALHEGGWDLILLDWWLPGGDGLTLLRRYREAGGEAPVLFLTARDAVSDRVRGLDGGADDYLCKPFDFDELLARVRALVRRRRGPGTVLSYRDVRLDLAAGRVERAGRALDLTPKEYDLLAFFLAHPDQVLTRTRIYDRVWGESFDGLSNALEVQVMELRRKLEVHGPRLIHTLRGRGYLLGDRPETTSGAGMSLSGRLSAFFLGALAAVLAGFSAALYLLAAEHFRQQVDERLDGALATLAAAAEVGPGAVEWEPGERVLALGGAPGPDQVRWAIRDDAGHLIDRSPNLDPRRLSPAPPAGFASGRLRGRDGRPWRVATRRIAASSPGVPPRSAIPHARADAGPHHEAPALILIAFAPLGPTEATLRRLGGTLAGLSVGLWLVAAAVGRRLCRRALAPLRRMADAARGADAADPAARLPAPGTGDELEDLGQAFNGLLDRLHEALERQRRFSGDASHQLRTPLAGLLGQVDVALRRDRPPEEYRRVLAVVRGKAAHLGRIVESLLFLARAEAEAGAPVGELLDLDRWLPDHLDAWRHHPRAADLRREDGDAPGPRLVRAHPPLLAQLVDNLLENAFKYSPEGTPVTVGLAREDGALVLAVADRGCGLAPEELRLVFEPFYRSPSARRAGQAGVGLGLAVARRIVAASGGTIRAERLPDAGSRFVVRLPEVAPRGENGAAPP